MTTQNEISECPPRYLTVPQVPVPQTCNGVLSDYGLPSDPFPIEDLPADFGWMSEIPIYYDSFEMKVGTLGRLRQLFLPGNPSYFDNVSWHRIPFSSSKWWNGIVRLHFMAIKPQQVTGKILFTYFPDISNDIDGTTPPIAPNKISAKVEWDLGLTSEFALDVPGFNPTFARPTWLSRVATQSPPTDASVNYCTYPLAQLSMGLVNVEAVQSLQPGSIYPDSIRIIVFQSFPGASFAVSTDPRSSLLNVLNFDNNLNYPISSG